MKERYTSTQFQARGGFVHLLAVLIVSAIGIAVTFSLLAVTIQGSKVAFVANNSFKAKAAADGCAELSLQTVTENPFFGGSGVAMISAVECSYAVVNTPLSAATNTVIITGEANSMDVVRRVRVEAEISTTSPAVISLTSWQEVADF